jgi:nucleoid-associated protein YgaU
MAFARVRRSSLVTTGVLIAGCAVGPSQPAADPVLAPPPAPVEVAGRHGNVLDVGSSVSQPSAAARTRAIREVIVAPAETRTYTVVPGDTAWQIAADQLGNGQRWKELAALNPEVDIQSMKSGTILLLPPK